MDEKQLTHLKQILDSWSLVLPKDMAVTREGCAAVFRDKDGVLRMTMPWEDYEAVLKWYADERKETAT
jgi:hypothetical protein